MTLRGTIELGEKQIAYIVDGMQDRAQLLVKRSKMYSKARRKVNRSRGLLEEISESPEFKDERLKGKIEAFLESTGEFPVLSIENEIEEEDKEEELEEEDNDIKEEDKKNIFIS